MDIMALRDKAERLEAQASRVAELVDTLDVLPSLTALRRVNELLAEIAQELILYAASETSISQKALAEAIGMSPSALTGLRRSRVA